MKKFELYSAAICKPEGIAFVKNTVKADNYADIIQKIERTQVGTLLATELSKLPISRRLWNEI